MAAVHGWKCQDAHSPPFAPPPGRHSFRRAELKVGHEKQTGHNPAPQAGDGLTLLANEIE